MIRLIFRSLVHYWRSNVLLVAAVAVTACLLTGALLLGDAMRGSLNALVEVRLGRVEQVVHAPAGYFGADLADSLNSTGHEAAAVIVTQGALSMVTDATGAVPVTVYGVDSAFFAFGTADVPGVVGSRVLTNQALARYGFEAGSRVRLKVTPHRPFNTDSFLSQQEDRTESFTATAAGSVPDSGMGRFSIRQDHYERPALFVSRRMLARIMGINGRANLIVLGNCGSCDVKADLNRYWRPADNGYELARVRGGLAYELRSERVFITAAVGDAVLAALPDGYGVNTYFVNTLSKGYAAVPYSFVSTANALMPVRDLDDDGIILNDWTAGRMFAETGDTVLLAYFVENTDGSLADASRSFIVRDIVPVNDANADPDLMPRFPGFAGALECRYWDPGVPIDVDRISDADETYWADWQGTPKAYVSPGAYRATWPNRYGAYTALRFPADAVRADTINAVLRTVLTPERAGIEIRHLRAEGKASVRSGVDFGSLFLGLSFFIIAAAVMLTVLLFSLMTEQRANQTGTLRALGFTGKRVTGLLMAEGAVIAVIGAAAGTALGTGYQRLLVWALNGFWQNITTSFRADIHITPASLVIGGAVTVLLVPLAQWWGIRTGGNDIAAAQSTGDMEKHFEHRRRYRAVALTAVSGLAIAVAYAVLQPAAESLTAFSAVGIMVLMTVLAVTKYALVAFRHARNGERFAAAGLIRSFLVYRENRSVLIIGMLQVSAFIVLTIGMHHRATFTPERLQDHRSGSGGFSLLGESTLNHTDESLKPFGQALNRVCYGITESNDLLRVRVREGDDASCLNITRARQPKVLGIDVLQLQERKSFAFAELADGIPADAPWLALDVPIADGVYPAAVDQSVMVWGMGRSLGDTLFYVNSQGGQVKLVLVAALENSVFQGAVLVSDKMFRRIFPGEPGYGMLLMDTFDNALPDSVYAELTRTARKYGIFITRTSDRLQGFAEVQNTYLAIFFILGGLGLLLGSMGVGVVILKAGVERTYDFALLHAVGFTGKRIRRLLWIEHLLLLGVGLGSGAAAAFITALPAAGSLQGDFPLPMLLALAGILLLNGVMWVTIASWFAGRRNMVVGLRTE